MRAMRSALLLVVFLMVSGLAQAEEVYKFPDIKPEAELSAGYRLVGIEGSERAAEYEYIEDSIIFGGRLVAFPFPHRAYLELDVFNEKDYFGDMRYAYRDLVLSRWLNRTYFHNLDNIRLELSTDAPQDKTGDKYGIKSGRNDIFLRFKTPYFPFHLYVETRLINKEGASQQRFLSGSGWWNSMARASKPRDIDWSSQDVRIGANSHLGPVEVDISHAEKRFNASGDWFLKDTYTAAEKLSGECIRAAGDYPHNVIPDLKGSDTTFKAHTSYTGRVVGSVTVSKGNRENELSGATADYLSGAAELLWIPRERLSVIFKYRHRERDVDNPDSLSDGYYGLSSNHTAFSGIRNSISADSDVVSGDVKYGLKGGKRIKGVTFGIGYSLNVTRRSNTDEWKSSNDESLEDRTTENMLSFTSTAKFPYSVQFKARYRYTQVNGPLYPADPERSNWGALSLKWTPVKRFSAFLSYGITLEERGNVPFKEVESDRSVTRNKFAGNLIFLLSKNLTLTTSYAYLTNKVEQDLVYNTDSAWSAALTEPDAGYEDSARNYAAGLNYILKAEGKEQMRLRAEVGRTISEGNFKEDDFGADAADIKLEETVYEISGERWLKGGWGIGASYKHIDLDNRSDNPDISDGTADITLVSAMKRWN